MVQYGERFQKLLEVGEEIIAYGRDARFLQLTIGCLAQSESVICLYDPRRGLCLDTGENAYELGQLAQVFTIALLAKYIVDQKVSLSDPLDRYFAKASNPSQGPTVLQLITAAQGSVPLVEARNGLFSHLRVGVGYSERALLRRLRRLSCSKGKLESDIATLGLEYILGQAHGQGYMAALQAFLEEEFRLCDTRVGLTEAKLQGYDARGRAYRPRSWIQERVMAPRQGLSSTAKDLVKYAQACLVQEKSYLHACFEDPLRGQSDAERKGFGWSMRPGGSVAWCKGHTGGFESYIGLDFYRQTGVVLLSNYWRADRAGTIERIGQSVLRQL